MQLAIFGLGRMGMQIAKRLHINNFEVMAWNRGEAPRQELQSFFTEHLQHSRNARVHADVASCIESLTDEQRVFWVMLPNDVVESFIFDQLLPHLRAGDIVIDGGNSYYKDSQSRARILADKKIHFYDSGTSGGIWGFDRGFALMVGGDISTWDYIEPIFKTLSSGDNYALLGESGAGHFAKMVHNGIEYGFMQAIGEGYAVMAKSGFNYNLAEVTKVYQKGSVISSWLIDLTRNIFEHEDVAGTLGKVDSTGEGEWTVKTAHELGVAVPVIEASFKVRQESQKPENQASFSNKVVALLRKQFGGHKTY